MNKLLVKNSIFNVGYKVLNVFFPLLTSMYIARILGPEGVGRITYAQNILGYFLVFASVGIPTYGIKEIARTRKDSICLNRSFSELFIINSITTTICIVVYLFIVWNIQGIYSERAIFLTVGISLFLNYLNIDWFYAGMEEYVYITIRSTAVKILAIVFLFIFVRTKQDVVKYAFVYALGISANYFLNIANLKNKVTFTNKDLDLKRHSKPVIILLITLLATDLYNQIDITMMGRLCSKPEIGYYSYAIKIVRIVTSVSTAISATMLPRFSQYYSSGNDKKFQYLFDSVLSVNIAIVIPCMIGIFICSDNIINVLYGSEFLETVSLVKILSPIIIIISISFLCGSIVLTAINKEKYLLYATLTGAIVNIVLNSIAIPKYHGYGAAVASVLAECVVLIIHFCASRSYIKIRLITADALKTFFSAIVMTLFIIVVRQCITKYHISLIISIIIGVVTYTIMMYITKHTIVRFCFNLVTSKMKQKKNAIFEE